MDIINRTDTVNTSEAMRQPLYGGPVPSRGRSLLSYVAVAVIVLFFGAVLGVLVDPYLPASISNMKKGEMIGEEKGKREGRKEDTVNHKIHLNYYLLDV